MHIFNERISSKQKEKISKFATAAVAILLTFVLCVQPLGYSAYAVELEENDGTTEQTDPEYNDADVDALDSSSVEAEASANDDTAATVAESAATVGLDLAEQATLTYNDKVFANTDESFEVPANQELDFTVAANDGYQVSAVKTVAGDVEADLAADENGVYKVDADQVTNNLTIKVEVTAIADNDVAGIATMSADGEIATLAVDPSSSTEDDPCIINPGQSVELSASYSQGSNSHWQMKKSSTDWQSQSQYIPGWWHGDITVDKAVLTNIDNGSHWAAPSATFELGEDANPGDVYQVKYNNEIFYFKVAENSTFSVTINPSTIDMYESASASVEGEYQESIKWSSNDTSVATVDPDSGVITGIGAGETQIVATDANGMVSSAVITVEAPTCTVKFDLDGGNWAGASLSGKYSLGDKLWSDNTSLSSYGYPVKQGYVFVGWDSPVSQVVTGNVTYTARWQPVENGKTPVYVYTKVTGDGDTSDLVLNKDGWYTIGVIFVDSNALSNTQQIWDSNNNMFVTGVDINDPNVAATVNNAMEGIIRYSENTSISIDSLKYSILKIASGASDYVSEGNEWHLDCMIEIDDLANYTVKYVDNETNAVLDEDTYVGTIGNTIETSQYTDRAFPHYEFVRVDPESTLEIKNNSSENIITVYYSRSNDSLTYYKNDNSDPVVTYTQPGNAGLNINVLNPSIMKDFELEGYTFNGWNTAQDGSGQSYAIGDEYTLDENVEDNLYAQWSANDITLNFNGNGATSGSMTPETHKADSEFNLTKNAFVRDGYTFQGWSTTNDDTVEYGDGASYKMPTTETTLYAVWSANEDQLNYIANGGEGSMEPTTGKVDDEVTVAENTFTKTGYSFNGWNTAQDGSGQSYAIGDEYTLDENVEDNLYAQWSANDITLNFNGNGATSGSMTPETHKADSEFNLTKNAFVRDGYTFQGWSTTNDDTVEYGDGASYKMPTTETTLYAVWSANFDEFSAAGDEWTYDGSSRYIQVEGIYPGDTLTYQYGDNTVTATVNENSEIEGAPAFTNVSDTNEVTVTLTRGQSSTSLTTTMTISPAPLTVTTPSASKAYDGTPLTAEGTIEGLVNNETVGFTTTGSQTEVGSSTNTYTIVWAADDNEFTAQESNYTINENLGTLKVTEAPTQDTSEGTTDNTDNNGTDQDNSSSLVKTSDMVMPGVVIGIVLIAAACVAFAAYKSRRPRGRHTK